MTIHQTVDACICGMGPAGLMAAIRGLQSGQSVAILENREQFTRVQRTAIASSVNKILNAQLKHVFQQDHSGRLLTDEDEQLCLKEGLPLSEKEKKQLIKCATAIYQAAQVNDSTVLQLKDLQQLLKAILLSVAEQTPGKLIVHQTNGLTVDSASADNGRVQISVPSQATAGNRESTVINFKYAIGADGGRRALFKAIKQGKPDLEVTEAYGDFQLQSREQGAFHIVLPDTFKDIEHVPYDYLRQVVNSDETDQLLDEINDEYFQVLEEMGWYRTRVPTAYYFGNEQVMRQGNVIKGEKGILSGEVSPLLLEKRKAYDANPTDEVAKQAYFDLVSKWSSAHFLYETRLKLLTAGFHPYARLDSELGPDPLATETVRVRNYTPKSDGLSVYRKGKQRHAANVFESEITALTQTKISGKHGRRVYFVGDAAQGANFHLGHGVSDAILSAIQVTGKFDPPGRAKPSYLSKGEYVSSDMSQWRQASRMATESEILQVGEVQMLIEALRGGLKELSKTQQGAENHSLRVVSEKFAAISEVYDAFIATGNELYLESVCDSLPKVLTGHHFQVIVEPALDSTLAYMRQHQFKPECFDFFRDIASEESPDDALNNAFFFQLLDIQNKMTTELIGRRFYPHAAVLEEFFYHTKGELDLNALVSTSESDDAISQVTELSEKLLLDLAKTEGQFLDAISQPRFGPHSLENENFVKAMNAASDQIAASAERIVAAVNDLPNLTVMSKMRIAKGIEAFVAKAKKQKIEEKPIATFFTKVTELLTSLANWFGTLFVGKSPELTESVAKTTGVSTEETVPSIKTDGDKQDTPSHLTELEASPRERSAPHLVSKSLAESKAKLDSRKISGPASHTPISRPKV